MVCARWTTFPALSLLHRACNVWLVFLLVAGTVLAQPPLAKKKDKEEDWAENLLKDDPLTAKRVITRSDLETALQDPKRRETVIERHFSRASINVEEQKRILKLALGTDSSVIQRQALDQLSDLGLLEEVIAEIVLEMAEQGDATLRRAAILALQNFDWTVLEPPAWYRELVQQAMSSDDAREREAATRQVVAWGTDSVPAFLQALRSGTSSQREQAALALSRFLGAKMPQPTAGAPAPGPPEAPLLPTIGKGQAATATGPKSERVLDQQKPQLVRVYFGTNRALVANHPDARFRLALGMGALLLAVIIPYLRIRYRKVPDELLRRRRTAWVTFWLLMGGLALGLWGASTANDAWYLYRSRRVGPEFGAARSVNRQVYYGYCDVSIPPSHQVGLVEQPLLGAEDEARHVVIERSALLADEAFFQTVRSVLARCSRQDTFVFVHGYNVAFDDAARRTAQIHYDLEFQGVPIFYSWPSRANVRLYASDRNEIGYSVEHIKQFLLDVKNRVQPGRIHVVAHSMGAEGVARAISSLDEGEKVFDQVILAAPDIDTDVFREQLAPRLVQQSQRTTLYCSRNDWALHASYAFNDSPRVGDSSYGVVVRQDMDTVDASDIDTDLLGHSYYGDCLPILRDVRLMIERNLKPEERELERAVMPENLIYWLIHRAPQAIR